VDDYDEHWGQVWQTVHEETERRAIELHESGAFGVYKHNPEAEEVLRWLGKRYELMVVTSRRTMLMQETESWLNQHFAGVFTVVHYAGMWDKPDEHSHKMTQAELCQRIGASYLIDDQLKHCLAAAEVGITAVLYGDYAWNRMDSLPKGVTRCRTWLEVKSQFERASKGVL